MTIRKYDFITGIETSTAPSATDPVSPSDPVTLGFAERRFVQGTETQATITALKALATADRVDGDIVFVKDQNVAFRYDAGSVAAADDFFYLLPASTTGRWVRITEFDHATGNLTVPNNLTVTNDLTVTGNLTVDGTTTTINTATLNVEDPNIGVNKDGNQATANTNVSGLTVQMTDATDARIGYDSALASRFKVGEIGSESEIIVAAGAQSMTGVKTMAEKLVLEKELEFDELGADPAQPSAGFRKLYAKSTGFFERDSDGIITELGSGGGGGSGSGELNVIGSPDSASDWVASGAGVTVATTVTDSEIGLFPIKTTGIKITLVSGTDYVRYRFTMPEAIMNTKLKIQPYILTDAGYDAGEATIDLYYNAASDYSGGYTKVVLSSDVAGTTPIPKIIGRIDGVTFDSDSQEYYELRITNVSAGSAFLTLNDVIVGPGRSASGAIVTDSQPITLTTAGFGTPSNLDFRFERVGSWMHLRGVFRAGTTDGTTAGLIFPAGYTIDFNRVDSRGYLGTFFEHRAALTAVYPIPPGVLHSDSTNQAIYFAKQVETDKFKLDFGNVVVGANRWVSIDALIPIAEWAGGGTVNLGTNDVEYAATSGTWDANSSATVYGPAGVALGGALSSVRLKTVTWQRPVSPTDRITVEGSADRISWFPINGCNLNDIAVIPSVESTGSTISGVDTRSSGNTIIVIFRRYIQAANDDAPLTNWPSTNAFWRVKKEKAGAATGFGQVSANASGLMPFNFSNLDDETATRMGLKIYKHGLTYNGGNAPTITLAVGGGTLDVVPNSAFYPYQTSDGTWRCKGNFEAQLSSTSRTQVQLSVAGLVTKNLGSGQGVAGSLLNAGATPSILPYAVVNTGTFRYVHSSLATTNYIFNFDIELESKPTWAY